MRTARLRRALGILAMFAAASCMSPKPSMSDVSWLAQPAAVTVEADLFSGRPNPTWALSPGEIEQLFGLLRQLAPAPAGEAPPSRLGYRGLRLELVRQGAAAASAEVSGHRVLYRDKAGPRTLADPKGTVERFLVATGRGKVEASVYETLTAEVERTGNRERQP